MNTVAIKNVRLIRPQSGAALVVSLLFLVIMTILALSMSQTTTLEERMAGNARDANMAFQGAEAGLQDGESFLKTTRPTTIDPGYLQTTDLTQQNDSWWSANGTEYGTPGAQDLPALKSTLPNADPRYVVRMRAITDDSTTRGNNSGQKSYVYFYEIISRSTGQTPEAD